MLVKTILSKTVLWLPNRLFPLKKMATTSESIKSNRIREGQAQIQLTEKVFYNPVQEFNRDLSIAVLNTFTSKRLQSQGKQPFLQPGTKCDDGVTILEALAATGLRSIRYATEVSGIKQIIANDLSFKAVETMRENIRENQVEELITVSQGDAIDLMHKHKKDQFDVIDLDPYGCPSQFLDSAIQAVKDEGLLMITATDMAVLAGNSPETCHCKYGAISLKIKSCHEMVPRFAHAKLSMVYQCVGCDTFTLQPLGIVKSENKSTKFKLPMGPPVGTKCEHCLSSFHIGGPIWSAPIHSTDFVQEVLVNTANSLGTFKRIQGVLSVICEELNDCPLYYVLDKLTGTLHVGNPPMLTLRSALLNAGYQVSSTHAHRSAFKTNASSRVVWDVMRCWEKLHPISIKRKSETSPGNNILKIEPQIQCSFEMHPNANPTSRKEGFVRFQVNPLPFWGPGTKSTIMIGGEPGPGDKSKSKQGKRKRESEQSL